MYTHRKVFSLQCVLLVHSPPARFQPLDGLIFFQRNANKQTTRLIVEAGERGYVLYLYNRRKLFTEIAYFFFLCLFRVMGWYGSQSFLLYSAMNDVHVISISMMCHTRTIQDI